MVTMTKVYVAANGLGLGHIVRCHVVAHELAKHGTDVLFSTYLDGLEYARRARLNTVYTIPISYQVRPDGSVDLKATSTKSGLSLGIRRLLRQLVVEIRNIKRFDPDVVVVDSRLSSLLAARLLGKPVATILNQYRINLLHGGKYPKRGILDRVFLIIARLGWTFFGTLISELWCLSEVLLVPDFPPPLTISWRNLIFPKRHAHKVRFVGPLLDPGLQPASISGPVLQHLLKSHKPLVYAAISGPEHERVPLVRKLLPILAELPEQLSVVASCGNPSGANKPTRLGRVLVFEWMEDQDEMLQACDLIISRAGHSTILKAMTNGKPLLIVPTPFQTEQMANADSAKSLGIALVLEQERLSKESLLADINFILKSSEYTRNAAEIRRSARSFDSPRECRRIIEGLISGL